MPSNSSNVLNAAQVYRSAEIAISTQKEIHCDQTQQTKTTWTIFKFDEDPRLVPSNVLIANMKKTVFHTEVSISDLFIPRRFLPYGFYEISAQVQMKGLPDVFGSDSIYVEIIQTPWIKAGVTAGSFYTVPFGFVVRVAAHL